MFDFNNQIKADYKVKRIAADRITPFKILEQFKACALLESAYHATGHGKYSLLILNEAFTVLKKEELFYLKTYQGRQYKINSKLKSFLSLLDEFKKKSPRIDDLQDIPVPCGGLGFLGYEFFQEVENIKFEKKDDRDLYDNAFIFGRDFLIFDHLYEQAVIITIRYENEAQEIDLEKQLLHIESKIKQITVNGYEPDSSAQKFTAKIVSPDNHEQYIKNVNYIKNEIYQGNLFQCVISRRLEIETDLSPLQAYRNLRMKNPSPYMFYLNFSQFIIFGASPEVMVKVKNNKVIVRPIAGTRKRGKNQAEDLQLEEELKNDPKERAEHLMLIDLGRNDIGKVAVGGTVKLTEEMIVEKYSRVMHLVSEVEGELDSKYTTFDAIKATLPAGTVTGAPKIQAIKTIEALETYRRGPYAGVIGYFDQDGSLDSCIAIRTAIARDNKIWVQAGAGIVHDSIAEKEFEESQNKMMALLEAINISIDQ